MAVIGSDGLSLLVGDGAGSELFSPLKGAAVTRLEISQRSNVNNAISDDAWLVHAGASGRRAVIECEAYATDEAPATRVRSLAMNGDNGNFRLKVSSTQTLSLNATVTMYREMIAAGGIKRLQCRLESSGAAVIS